MAKDTTPFRKTVQRIVKEVEDLPTDWRAEVVQELWDLQIKRDVAEGRLDDLIQQSRRQRAAGDVRDL